MTTKRAFLLLVLSAVIASPASAAPGAAALVAPHGDVSGSTMAFSWQAAPESTWYLFWLGTERDRSLINQHWYSAEQVGCANGGTCTITLTPALAGGGYIWFIQTWAGGVFGPWSEGMTFIFRDPMPTWSRVLPNSRRFTLVLDDQAVLDNETGLTWDRSPGNAETWVNAWTSCVTSLGPGGRRGWRLPSIDELTTLTSGSDNLPSGHPFMLGLVPGSRFWSHTIVPDTSLVLVAHFDLPSLPILGKAKTDLFRVWCVRGPGGASR